MAAGLAQRLPGNEQPRTTDLVDGGLIPQSAPPVSRSVVKPRISMARIEAEVFAASRVNGTSASSRRFTSVSTT